MSASDWPNRSSDQNPGHGLPLRSIGYGQLRFADALARVQFNLPTAFAGWRGHEVEALTDSIVCDQARALWRPDRPAGRL